MSVDARKVGLVKRAAKGSMLRSSSEHEQVVWVKGTVKLSVELFLLMSMLKSLLKTLISVSGFTLII